MTREENRELILSLRPLLEQTLKAAAGKDINSISIHADPDDYGYIKIGDYEIVRINGETSLEYRPHSELLDWETEKILPSGNPGEEA